MVNARSLGKKPYETLRRVARLYADTNGYSKKEVRKSMDDFLLQCDPSYSLVKWADTIDYAVNYAFKHPAISLDGVHITEPELNRIATISSVQTRRLAFTLLCLSRYWDLVNPKSDHWVNTKDGDIMKMANVSTSIRRQCAMYHTLFENGMIQLSKRVDNTNVRVLFGEEGEVAMTVTDFRNLGYQYMMHYGGAFSVCESCGITFKDPNKGVGRPRKYCDLCAAKIRIQQNVNSVMRHRGLIS